MLRLKNIVATVIAALIPAAVAFAQSAPQQPNINSGQRSAVWVGYVVAFIFAALLVIATILPSKRSQDDI